MGGVGLCSPVSTGAPARAGASPSALGAAETFLGGRPVVAVCLEARPQAPLPRRHQQARPLQGGAITRSPAPAGQRVPGTTFLKRPRRWPPATGTAVLRRPLSVGLDPVTRRLLIFLSGTYPSHDVYPRVPPRGESSGLESHLPGPPAKRPLPPAPHEARPADRRPSAGRPPAL